MEKMYHKKGTGVAVAGVESSNFGPIEVEGWEVHADFGIVHADDVMKRVTQEELK